MALVLMEQQEILAVGEALHLIHTCASAEVGQTFNDVEDGRASEDDMQLGMIVINQLQFTAPVMILVDLVDDKVVASGTRELASEVYEVMGAEIKVFGCDIQSLGSWHIFFEMLKYQRCLADATRSDKTYHACIPFDFAEEVTMKVRCRFTQQFVEIDLKSFHRAMRFGLRGQRYRKRFKSH